MTVLDLTADRSLPTAAALASTPVVTVEAGESLLLAAHLLQRGPLHHLPVVADGSLVGMLDVPRVTDALARATWTRLRAEVRTAMQPYVVQVAPDDPLPLVAERLLGSGCGAVVVVRDRALVGLVTVTDVLKAVAAR